MGATQAEWHFYQQGQQGGAMTKEERREHRHHKHERVRQAIQAHGGGRRPIVSRFGLQLPEIHYSPLARGPSYNYPPGWTFKRPGPAGSMLLYGGGMLIVIVIALAIVHIFGG